MPTVLCEGHTKQGRWILVPLSDILTPKNGRICYGERWWAVTPNNEVLFFDTYFSPQCHKYEAAVKRRPGHDFHNMPATTPRFLPMVFIPRSSD